MTKTCAGCKCEFEVPDGMSPDEVHFCIDCIVGAALEHGDRGDPDDPIQREARKIQRAIARKRIKRS
jgi:hypothetical protein